MRYSLNGSKKNKRRARHAGAFFSNKKLYGTVFAPLLARSGSTQAEMNVLLFLANNPAYDTARDITERRHMAKSQVSVSVEALVERGLLERFYRPGNRKTIHLRPTPAARPLVEEGWRLQNRFGALLIAGFSRQEILRMASLIRRMQKNIDTALTAEKQGEALGQKALEQTEEWVASLRLGEEPE